MENNETIKQNDELIQNESGVFERRFAESLANIIQEARAEGKTDEEIKKEFIETHKVELKDDDTTAYPKPRQSCPHCYGRGYEGWFADGKVKICRWLTNNFGLLPTEQLLTLGELNKILSTPKPASRVKKMSKKRKYKMDVEFRKAQGLLRRKGGQRW